MKKTVFFIVATWFACTVVSCEKRESPASEGIQKEVTIGCYTEVADVKTSLSGSDTEGYSVVWSTDDRVRTRSVSGSGGTDGGSAITLLPSYAGKTYAKFKGTINYASDPTAFEAQYPANYPEKTVLSLTNQNDSIGSQHYKAGSPDFMPMFAREEVGAPEQLHFSNLMGVIRLDLHNNGTTDYRVKRISYTASAATYPLMGHWNNVLQEDGHYMAVYKPGAPSEDLTLDCGEEGVVVPAGGTMQFFVSALPKEYADFGFTITNTEDKVVEVKMKAGKTFQVTRSRISTVSLPVEASAFVPPVVRPVAANEIIYTTSDGKQIDIYEEGEKFPVKDSFVTVSDHEFDSETSTGIITFASNVTAIGAQAFKGKSTITDVRFSNAVTYIGEEAFMDCTGLQAIKLPNSVVTIQQRAFQGCTGVESAVIGRVTSLSQYTFQGCTSLKKIVLPSSLLKINSYVFNRCTSLETIVIPDGVTDLLGGNNFSYCTELKSIDMGNGTYTTIPPTAFKGCANLTEITIPASVTTIGNQAFNSCSNLATIRFKRSVSESASATAPVAEDNATFNGCKKGGEIIVPDGCLEAYVAAWRVGINKIGCVPKTITIREETSGRTEPAL